MVSSSRCRDWDEEWSVQAGVVIGMESGQFKQVRDDYVDWCWNAMEAEIEYNNRIKYMLLEIDFVQLGPRLKSKS